MHFSWFQGAVEICDFWKALDKCMRVSSLQQNEIDEISDHKNVFLLYIVYFYSYEEIIRVQLGGNPILELCQYTTVKWINCKFQMLVWNQAWYRLATETNDRFVCGPYESDTDGLK